MKAEELIKIREEKKLTKTEFAKAIGVTAMLLGRYEKGSASIPEEVAKKALALGAAKAAKEAVEKKVEKKVEKAVKDTAKKTASKAVKEAEKKVVKGAAKKAVKAAAGAAAADAVVKKAVKAKAAPVFTIESKMGGQITYDEVLKKLPKGVEQIYVKPEENKAYWVKGKKSGEILLWE